MLFLLASIFSFLNINDKLSYKNPYIASTNLNVITVYLGEGFKNPGIYEIPANSKVKDVLALYANTYNSNLHSIDLDKNIVDGEKIELKAKSNSSQQQYPTASFDINSTNADELMQVKGIGEKTAQNILNFIKENGPIKDLNQLTQVKGIGERTIENLRVYYHL